MKYDIFSVLIWTISVWQLLAGGFAVALALMLLGYAPKAYGEAVKDRKTEKSAKKCASI